MRSVCEIGLKYRILPEGDPLKGLYLRWAVLLSLFGVIGLLGWGRYNREVRAQEPKALLKISSGSDLRVIGRIEGGSLVRGSEGKPFEFTLSGEGEQVSVNFMGEDQDTLRELKTIVVIGSWDGENRHFKAKEIALIPNYDFITWAYLTSLIPLAFFIFRMERKVALLYIMIKEEKAYQRENLS